MPIPLPRTKEAPAIYAWAVELVQILRQTFPGLGGNESLIGVGFSVSSESSSVAGEVRQTARAAAPSGWLACDGSLLQKSEYPALFAAIDIRWNIGGEGDAFFRLPNAAGKYVRGAAASLALYGGSNNITLAAANLPVAPVTITDPGHTHTFTGTAHGHNVPNVLRVGPNDNETSAGSNFINMPQTDSTVASNTVAGGTNATSTADITAQLNGANTPVAYAPEYVSFLWIIKT